MSKKAVNRIVGLIQALSDPENQPHQWIGNGKELLEVLTSALGPELVECREVLAGQRQLSTQLRRQWRKALRERDECREALEERD